MADIGGPLAHQLPLHNHRGGLVQPSLVMNHHLDMDSCHTSDMHQSKFPAHILYLVLKLFVMLHMKKTYMSTIKLNFNKR